jgi:hypothetical protein
MDIRRVLSRDRERLTDNPYQVQERPDKGKPPERVGRKVTGLSPKEGYGSRIAGQDITFTGEDGVDPQGKMTLRPSSHFHPARVHVHS